MSITNELNALKDSVLEFKEYLKHSDEQSTENRSLLGNADSQFKMYEASKTDEEKIKWLQLSAGNGNGKAYPFLAFYYSNNKDYKNAVKYYKKAIEVNEKISYTKTNLALIYIQTIEFRDLQEAEKLLEEAKEEQANFWFINHCYGALYYIKEDYEKSKEFFEKTYCSSDVKSYYQAKMFIKGQGYKKNISRAIDLMKDNINWPHSKTFFKAVEELDI
jgi:tetratricopeptide (TPR) repeat protein